MSVWRPAATQLCVGLSGKWPTAVNHSGYKKLLVASRRPTQHLHPAGVQLPRLLSVFLNPHAAPTPQSSQFACCFLTGFHFQAIAGHTWGQEARGRHRQSPRRRRHQYKRQQKPERQHFMKAQSRLTRTPQNSPHPGKTIPIVFIVENLWNFTKDRILAEALKIVFVACTKRDLTDSR